MFLMKQAVVFLLPALQNLLSSFLLIPALYWGMLAEWCGCRSFDLPLFEQWPRLDCFCEEALVNFSWAVVEWFSLIKFSAFDCFPRF